MWIIVSFKINQDSIAKTLCVKKEIKNNTCQGKCHLKKQLDKVNEEEQKQAPTSQKEKAEVLFCHTHKPYDFWEFADLYLSKLNASYQNNFYNYSYITDIFRPPTINLI